MELTLIVIGHIGRDCSVRHIENGSVAINFPVASTEKYKDKAGNWNERTTWIDCTVWRKPDTMKIADYLKKGQLVKIEGLPAARGYQSKDKTQIHGSIQCRVDSLLLLGGSNKQQQNGSSTGSTDESAEVFTATTQEDDLPF